MLHERRLQILRMMNIFASELFQFVYLSEDLSVKLLFSTYIFLLEVFTESRHDSPSIS